MGMMNNDVAGLWFRLTVALTAKEEKEQKRLVKIIRKDLQEIANGKHIMQTVRKTK